MLKIKKIVFGVIRVVRNYFLEPKFALMVDAQIHLRNMNFGVIVVPLLKLSSHKNFRIFLEGIKN